ncbi:hypothetical protein BHE74_00046354 [Ensete ventricosum]|nr:hypothetical protein GW17_00007746 [Ensete ventricosum]RWW47636.1 hypothetical protein BHE74_00046354 [Ensete ventricosum]RZS02432.1 hypothetical protein BHM03_00032484 [Ensete ventricosum]
MHTILYQIQIQAYTPQIRFDCTSVIIDYVDGVARDGRLYVTSVRTVHERRIEYGPRRARRAPPLHITAFIGEASASRSSSGEARGDIESGGEGDRSPVGLIAKRHAALLGIKGGRRSSIRRRQRRERRGSFA